MEHLLKQLVLFIQKLFKNSGILMILNILLINNYKIHKKKLQFLLVIKKNNLFILD